MHMLHNLIYLKVCRFIFQQSSGAIKAWHLHKEMTLNYAVILGEIKFVLYDDRKKVVQRSSSRNI